MYVAVKGGERAIEASRELLAQARRGDSAQPELSIEQIKQHYASFDGHVPGELQASLATLERELA